MPPWWMTGQIWPTGESGAPSSYISLIADPAARHLWRPTAGERRKNPMTRMKALGTTLLLVAIAGLTSAPAVPAASKAELDRDAARVLKNLYCERTPRLGLLGSKAKAVLVFPSIVKAGFMFGGQIGEGVLSRSGRPVGYYNSVAASYGLQAGVQVFGYALFFMNEQCPLLSRQERRLGGRRRPEHRRRRRGRRQVAHQHHDHAGRVCVHLRSEGADGRHGRAGLEDHEDLEVAPGDRSISRTKGVNTMSKMRLLLATVLISCAT